jgi:DNA polymerase-3 subunit gamma/tau
LDNVQYAPTRSRFKIYLIDEVHMLSNHSFNALLKTLEEPPEHVKFILATTDPQKLPATVLSRCLQFNLKNMVPEQIVGHLKHVLSEESVPFDNESLALLARGAEGSMRDALSLSDQAIAHGSGKLESGDVRQMLGTVSRTKVLDLLDALISDDARQALAELDGIASHSPDYSGTLDELASVLHQIALAQAVPGSIDTTQPEFARLESLASALTPDIAHQWLQKKSWCSPQIPEAVWTWPFSDCWRLSPGLF